MIQLDFKVSKKYSLIGGVISAPHWILLGEQPQRCLSSATRQEPEAIFPKPSISAPSFLYVSVCSAGIEPRASAMPGKQAPSGSLPSPPPSHEHQSVFKPCLSFAFSYLRSFSLLCGISSSPIPFPKGSYLKLFLAVFSTVPFSLFWVAKSLGSSWQKVRATGSGEGRGTQHSL